MPRIVRISAAQLPAVVAGRSLQEKQAHNRKHIFNMLKTAGARASDLVLFGEYANLYHRSLSSNKKEYVADPIPGELTRAAARFAKKYKMNVALPLFGTHRGVLSSWVVLLNREGKMTGCYQKTHPTISEQSLGMQAGNELPVYELDFGKVGIMTCMDIEYPEVAQILMLKGAEILLFPHVQSSWGEVDWEIRYRARAVDTGLYVVSACYGYPEGLWMPGMMIGRSGIIGRDGLILADIGRSIGVLTLEVDLDQKRVTQFFFNEKYDRTLAVAASRRPEIYGDLVEASYKKIALRKIKAHK
ncbi:MAG: carbon-nitrogen hydrolase family protein [candidate division KSB1 bacterium]|nr:carbon-nitrogen hydrolase family protein [candidate division KSB1 bacterium]MDZ7304119.1 carbon-nitrogen hydrolase family protein [candidate division KSB1 bacterium]MDZ7313384.1 carbon-nitrogen hydrolase family protein [candidate division KSB1 bacterium]